MHHLFKASGLLDKILTTVAAVVFVVVLLELALWSLLERGPPIDIVQVETLNSPVNPGDILRVKVTREKLRDCPDVSFRQAMDDNGTLYELGVSLRPNARSDASPSYVAAYALPRDMPPGNYVLIVRVLYTCPDQAYAVRPPDTKFIVRESYVEAEILSR